MTATRRSCFLLSALYDLPFGANRRFHSHANRIAYLAPGGWSVSTVSLWETGPYLKPISSSSYDPGNLSLPIVADFRGRIASETAISLPTSVCSNQRLQHNPFGASRELRCRNTRKTMHLHGRRPLENISISRSVFVCALRRRSHSWRIIAISRHRRGTDVTRSNCAFGKSAASSVARDAMKSSAIPSDSLALRC